MVGIWAFLYSGKLYEGISKAKHKTEDKKIQTWSKTVAFIIWTDCNSQQKFFRGWKNLIDWSSIKQGVISCPTDLFYVTKCFNHMLFVSGAKGLTLLLTIPLFS